MKEINVLSWGGGTQSTALMLLMLEGKVKDENNKPIELDYIIFSDTGDESQMIYAQVFKIQKYIEDTYGKEIVITKKTKTPKELPEMIDIIKGGSLTSQYKSSEYADLYQEQVLFYMGIIDQANLVPSWVINKNGELGKMMGRNCTVEYKIVQIMKELRILENLSRFDKTKHKVNMFIGFSSDEISRVKPSPQSYIVNKFPLVDLNLTKIQCIDYVKEKLGFKPKSSVCNICYANTFDTVYDIYLNDQTSWQKLLLLDEVMKNKQQKKIKADEVYLFHWQAKMRKRLLDIDMQAEHSRRHKYNQLSIYDVMEDEEQMACMGGCFL
jgi:hypothetical protein